MITILWSGSRGDIQPYIAPAQEIQKLGHHVRIAAGVNYKDFIEDYGVEVFPLSDAVIAKAKTLGEHIANENGAATCAKVITGLVFGRSD